MALSKPTLRKERNVYLLGNHSPVIEGSKLPSKKQVLRVLFFNLREVQLSLRDSAHLVVQEVIIFWNKARIPVHYNSHCVKKVEDLYEQWSRYLQKNANKCQANFKANFRARTCFSYFTVLAVFDIFEYFLGSLQTKIF
ncbi:unnamed protein product [Bemisia tabaci]|uniref:Uncharacterized protein n=1 Tax=Bemisia tabaci TaxID=7038 RepID=A0A9P0AP77_BEMTA|nr:unnamed protein product [Bemisia tabaci]